MFTSPRLSRTSMDIIATKHILNEKCQTIEQLKIIIDDLKVRHEKKEHELIKQIGILYNDLQQNKKKMAHLILKYQQQKKFNENMKTFKDFSCQTDENNLSLIYPDCSTNYDESKSYCTKNKTSEQHPKYYTVQRDDHIEYISAIPQPQPQPQSHHSLSSPSLSTTDQSSGKHNESSSSAYNTAESLPSSSAYSDENESLERVLNAACTMYTTHDNLEHTIKLQEELFRQRLRLRGINLNNNDNNNHNNKVDNHQDNSSEHFYDNIDSETSDIEKQTTMYRNRSLSWFQKKPQRTVTFNLNNNNNNNEQLKNKMTPQKVRFSDQYYSLGKRKNFKSTSKTNLSKLVNNKKYNCQNSNITNKKLLSSNMLTVAIT